MQKTCDCINVSSGMKCKTRVIPGMNYCYLHQRHFEERGVKTVAEWNRWVREEIERRKRGEPAAKLMSPRKARVAKKDDGKKKKTWIRGELDTLLEDGFKKIETFANGKLHSYNDNPAVVFIDSRGRKSEAYWFRFGKQFRKNGPDHVVY